MNQTFGDYAKRADISLTHFAKNVYAADRVQFSRYIKDDLKR